MLSYFFDFLNSIFDAVAITIRVETSEFSPEFFLMLGCASLFMGMHFPSGFLINFLNLMTQPAFFIVMGLYFLELICSSIDLFQKFHLFMCDLYAVFDGSRRLSLIDFINRYVFDFIRCRYRFFKDVLLGQKQYNFMPHNQQGILSTLCCAVLLCCMYQALLTSSFFTACFLFRHYFLGNLLRCIGFNLLGFALQPRFCAESMRAFVSKPNIFDKAILFAPHYFFPISILIYGVFSHLRETPNEHVRRQNEPRPAPAHVEERRQQQQIARVPSRGIGEEVPNIEAMRAARLNRFQRG